jgi:hypothetical protein
MLPLLYQKHLKNQLEDSELLFLELLIKILQDIKEVSLEKLSTALPLPILFNSRRKKVQRFLSLPTINIEKLWLPIIKNWLSQTFTSHQNIYLIIDRTNWARNHLIMISIVYDCRAIPVYFELLPKLGCSSFADQKRVFSQVLPLFKKFKITVLADREFCSIHLANWLRGQEVEFCLRLKKNENVELKNGDWYSLDNLGLKPGICLFYSNIKVTKTKNMQGFNLAGKWQKKLQGCTPHEGWFILTNLCDLPSAISAYKKRFAIEEMFRDFKSGGYKLESTNVAGNRLISLLLIMAFAYSSSTFKGQKIKQKGVQKYVGRVREYGRLTRRHSSFYIGLYGQTWVKFMDDCWGLVAELMKLNRNKLEHYLRGMRAMKLILATF